MKKIIFLFALVTPLYFHPMEEDEHEMTIGQALTVHNYLTPALKAYLKRKRIDVLYEFLIGPTEKKIKTLAVEFKNAATECNKRLLEIIPQIADELEGVDRKQII